MNKKGIAFLTTVIILGIITLVCAGLTFVVINDAYSIKQLRYATQAFCLAEAGVEEAVRTLYDTGFDTSGYPMANIALGNGTYSVALTNHPTDDLVLITSTGTVRGVSRTVEAMVRDNTIDAFTYPVLCGGRLFIAGGLALFGGANTQVYGGDVRSNSANQNWAVYVGGLITSGYVDEDAYACGRIRRSWLGVINGDENPNSPAVEMPPFDASFFDYYKDLAQNGGLYYNGHKTFTAGTYTPGNGVMFVNGNATVRGNVTINGCLVATGQIRVNPNFGNYTFTQNQVGNLPALMTKGGNIGIYCPSTINGLIYTSNRITTFSLPVLGVIDIDGIVIGKGGVFLYAVTQVDFVPQTVPGIPGTDSPVQIEAWSG